MDVANHRARLVRGITLLELITTLAVAGISLAVIVPSWTALTQHSRLTTAANRVLTHLRYARSEAVTRGEAVTLCPSDDGSTCSGDAFGWQRGYMVFVDSNGDRERTADEAPLRVQRSADRGLRLHTSAGRPAIRFRPDGTAWGTNATFRLCAADGGGGRAVVLYGSGRARIHRPAPGSRPITCDEG